MDSAPRASKASQHSNKHPKQPRFQNPAQIRPNLKRSHADNNYQPRPANPGNTKHRHKKPRVIENPPDKNPFTLGQHVRPSRPNYQPRSDNPQFRPMFNPNHHERFQRLPHWNEMFYQNGRLPTGQYVRAVDNSRAEDDTESSNNADGNADSMRQTLLSAIVPRQHFLLQSMPRSNKDHVALPFVHCNNTEKTSTKDKEPSSTTPAAAAISTESLTSSSSPPSQLAIKKENPPSLEDINRGFKELEESRRIKQETSSDNSNNDGDLQSPTTIEQPDFEMPSTISSNPKKPIDFTADNNLSFDYPFSPAIVRRNEYNSIPDLNGDKNNLINDVQTLIANKRKQKAELVQQAKDLASQLTRTLNEIELVDIEIDQANYKANALRQ